jgi:leucyl/phenylalanyl-tRNA--protein transferase
LSEGITLIDVLNAYCAGMFPMADSADAQEFFWYDPPQRTQIPIKDLHIPKRLLRTVRQGVYEVRVDTAFEVVIGACAKSTENRPKTWINEGIREIFITLHEKGFAHSVECWKDGTLVGGVYGLAIGGFFSGESMFSRQRDASKVALVHLCARLWRGGFTVLDAQFMNDHLRQFGAYEISRDSYLNRLQTALPKDTNFVLKELTESNLVETYLSDK